MLPPPPRSTLFPYTTLFRSELRFLNRFHLLPPVLLATGLFLVGGWSWLVWGFFVSTVLDRKSTRLNSSHVSISYAVFCLKKKNNPNICAMKTTTEHETRRIQ